MIEDSTDTVDTESPPEAGNNALAVGALWGLLFGLTWLCVEGVYLAFTEPNVPTWTVCLNPAAGAPVVLLLGAVCAVMSRAWAGVPQVSPSGVRAGLRGWLQSGTEEALAWRSAWILTAVILGLVWFASGVEAGRRITDAVVTPGFQAALLILVQLASALALSLASPLLALPLAKMLIWISGKGALGERVSRPGGVLAAMGLGCIVGFVGAWALFGEVLRHFPWGLALGPVLGAVVATRIVAATRERAGRLSVAAAVAVLILALFGAYLPDSLRAGRAIFVGQSSLASAWVGTIERLLDADHDGASHLYAGGDCAPDDPAIGPHAREIVGNGVDEDCWRGDLVVEPEALSMGPKHHPQPRGISGTPNIVLITIDALGYDHTNAGGYERALTPNLADWSSRSTLFEAAFAVSPSTRLAMPAIVTSMFNSMVPMKNGRKHPYAYGDDVVTTAQVLEDKGYRTVHVVSNKYFDTPRWGGYWRGFQEIDRTYRKAADAIHTAPEITDATIAHLQSEDPRPLFLWVHYYDVHHPYRTPAGREPYGKREVDHYDAELKFLDEHLGRLLDAIEARWEPEDRVVLLTSDHGEAFDRNHTREHHDFSLHTAVLHIPLIIQGPWEAGRGKRPRGLASQLDILPTIASLVGAPPEELWQGESLVPSLVSGAEPEKKVVYSMFYIPEDAKRDMDGFRRFGVRTDDLYYFTTFELNDQRLVRWRTDLLDGEDVMTDEPDAAVLFPYLVHTKVDWLREHERSLKKPWKRAARPRAKRGPGSGVKFPVQPQAPPRSRTTRAAPEKEQP